jgi:hypothetical protein
LPELPETRFLKNYQKPGFNRISRNPVLPELPENRFFEKTGFLRYQKKMVSPEYLTGYLATNY